MKTSIAASILFAQLFLFSSYGLESEQEQPPKLQDLELENQGEAEPDQPSFLRERRLGACFGTPSRSDCAGLSKSDCGTIRGCDWTVQHGNKCWGTPMKCEIFNKPGHGESWCNSQPGCSWSGGSSGGAALGGGVQGCFSGDTTVQVLKNSEVATKKMMDLTVGERVRTGDNTFERVYAFGHRDVDNKLDYIKLSIGKSESIELSKEHLIFANGKATRADNVKIGDILSKDENPTEVTKISKIQNKKGMYAPLTAGGTIVVNGVLASTYVALQSESLSNTADIKIGGITLPFLDQHSAIHLVISPLRIICGMSRSSLGVCQGEYDNDDGINAFVAWGMDTIAFMEQQPVLIQVLVVLFSLVASLALGFFETVVLGTGPLFIRLAVFLACSSLVSLHARGTQKIKSV